MTVSAYTTDNELLVASLPTGGTYYIHVFSPDGPTGQRYDLWWVGQQPPDNHEEDDTAAQAAAQATSRRTRRFQTSTGRRPVHWDLDYYMINIPDLERLVTVGLHLQPRRGQHRHLPGERVRRNHVVFAND